MARCAPRGAAAGAPGRRCRCRRRRAGGKPGSCCGQSAQRRCTSGNRPAWRQQRYGNLRLRDALLLGVLAAPSAVGGVAIVNAVPERAVALLFAALLVFVAVRMLRSD